METMAISKFKATCLARPPREWLGSLRGTLEIRGDIVAPSSELATWKALR
jgi:hypothetical protein